ncbi:MAG TPA: DUF350 domain-containing protein [Candidatus Polarisedimenticolaceae bacterium]
MTSVLGILLPWRDLATLLAQTAMWSLLGIVLFAFAIWVMGKLSPFSLRKEIEQDHNVAMGIVMGAALLGLAIIVAAAISG